MPSPSLGHIYLHKTSSKAASTKQKPKPSRQSLTPVLNPPPLTSWGTAYPLWNKGDTVLVQLHTPDGDWRPAIIVETLKPLELRNITEEEAKMIPSAQLEYMACRYTVKLTDEDSTDNVWTEVQEIRIVPTHLAGKLKANAAMFKMGERVMVQLSDGNKAETQIGRILAVGDDRVIRDKSSWDVVPRLYTIYLEKLESSGHWTASSIIKLGN